MAEKLYSLLVVEDNDGDVFLIKKALREYRIPVGVSVCSDGESAVRVLESPDAGPPPDAIILDLSLPLRTGLDVLRSMLNRPGFVGIPIMVFTSSPSPADKHRVQLLGGVRYVQKPSGVDNFLREVGENVQAMLAEADKRDGGQAP